MNREETDTLLIAQINALYAESQNCYNPEGLANMASTMALAYDVLQYKRDALKAIMGELDLLQRAFRQPGLTPYELTEITKATVELSDALTWT